VPVFSVFDSEKRGKKEKKIETIIISSRPVEGSVDITTEGGEEKKIRHSYS